MGKRVAAPEAAPNLEHLGAELAGIAAQLAVLAQREALARARGSGGAPEAGTVAARVIRTVIADRARRALWFGQDLRHPGWSLLLELFACRLEGRTPTLAELQPAAGVPMTTVSRWVDRLAGRELLVRRAGGGRGRATVVALTDEGARRMHGYLTAALVPASEPAGAALRREEPWPRR